MADQGCAWGVVRGRVKLAVLDHVASFPPVLFDMKALCSLCRASGAKGAALWPSGISGGPYALKCSAASCAAIGAEPAGGGVLVWSVLPDSAWPCSAGGRRACCRGDAPQRPLAGRALLLQQPAQVGRHSQGLRLSVGGPRRAAGRPASRDFARLWPGALPSRSPPRIPWTLQPSDIALQESVRRVLAFRVPINGCRQGSQALI